jgi:hypothetical protein
MPSRLDVVNWSEYNDGSRIEYFAWVCQFLTERAFGITHVVFVDPDTGIESTNPNSKHMRTAQLTMVWCCLQQGDILLVYQHAPQNRLTEWVAGKVEQFADALAIPSTSVHWKTELDVCFLWAFKEQPSHALTAEDSGREKKTDLLSELYHLRGW